MLSTLQARTTLWPAYNFAQTRNIRISIKNTGHDYLGKSSGEGSLGFWTHNLKSISFSNYTSAKYKGPSIKMGAGVQAFEAYEAASGQDLHVVGGDCPSVGLAGGYSQAAGHGPLATAHGLGSDQILEREVMTG
ncbi:hypothetical protein MMC16_005801 [Acarospora aff. strigata]|nr:hypothetical protein [Acarospora aff. strigata]